jgi:hypothetical protein
MNRRSQRYLAVVAVLLVAFLACSKKSKDGKKDYMVLGEYVSQDSLPRLRYFDGNQVSLNDRCAVRKVKLNPKMPPVYVNGQPVGFC